ncbi:MAG: hypothetical protein HQL53_08740 [Magnetococcales bacterium]|nr:hypothetical protein [Magnetococcales bacterium]
MNGKKGYQNESYGEEMDDLLTHSSEMVKEEVDPEMEDALDVLDDMCEEVEEHENLVM